MSDKPLQVLEIAFWHPGKTGPYTINVKTKYKLSSLSGTQNRKSATEPNDDSGSPAVKAVQSGRLYGRPKRYM